MANHRLWRRDSKSLIAPYFETLTYADMTLTYAEKIYKFFSAWVGVRFQRKSAFKTGVTSRNRFERFKSFKPPAKPEVPD